MNIFRRRTFLNFSRTVFFLSFFAGAIFSQIAFAEKITFSARSMSGRAGSKEDETTLSGNANVTTETIEVKADSIQLSGKEFRYVAAKGKITGKHKESNLEFSSDELSYDRETKIVTLSGNVKLVDVENKVDAQAQIIEYNTNTEIAILQIEVNLKQKKNVCTAAYAIYRKKEQMLELNGSAKVVQDSDTFSAQAITFNMDTEEIVMEGNVRGSVTDDGSHDSKKSEKEKASDSKENKSEKVEEENSAQSEDEKKSEESADESSNENSSDENENPKSPELENEKKRERRKKK